MLHCAPDSFKRKVIGSGAVLCHCAVDTVDLSEYVTSSGLTMKRQETSCSGSDEISSRLNSIFGHRKLSISFLLTAVKLCTVTWLWPHCTPLNWVTSFHFSESSKNLYGNTTGARFT